MSNIEMLFYATSYIYRAWDTVYITFFNQNDQPMFALCHVYFNTTLDGVLLVAQSLLGNQYAESHIKIS